MPRSPAAGGPQPEPAPRTSPCVWNRMCATPDWLGGPTYPSAFDPRRKAAAQLTPLCRRGAGSAPSHPPLINRQSLDKRRGNSPSFFSETILRFVKLIRFCAGRPAKIGECACPAGRRSDPGRPLSRGSGLGKRAPPPLQECKRGKVSSEIWILVPVVPGYRARSRWDFPCRVTRQTRRSAERGSHRSRAGRGPMSATPRRWQTGR